MSWIIPIINLVGPLLANKLLGGELTKSKNMKEVRDKYKKYKALKGGLHLVPVSPMQNLVDTYKETSLKGK